MPGTEEARVALTEALQPGKESRYPFDRTGSAIEKPFNAHTGLGDRWQNVCPSRRTIDPSVSEEVADEKRPTRSVVKGNGPWCMATDLDRLDGRNHRTIDWQRQDVGRR
ncbi:MAG TPA: hypothetical protein VIP11_06540 [Gemmatimonadaceae bacterium]